MNMAVSPLQIESPGRKPLCAKTSWVLERSVSRWQNAVSCPDTSSTQAHGSLHTQSTWQRTSIIDAHPSFFPTAVFHLEAHIPCRQARFPTQVRRKRRPSRQHSAGTPSKAVGREGWVPLCVVTWDRYGWTRGFRTFSVVAGLSITS